MLTLEAILQLPRGSIAIRRRYQNSPSETSFLVQASDVVGNFVHPLSIRGHQPDICETDTKYPDVHPYRTPA